jgi:inner membrane protein
VASAPSHAAFAVALGAWLAPDAARRRSLVAAGLLAMLPDIDAVGYWLGVPTSALLGHRGLTHSIAFALVAGLVAALLMRRRVPEQAVSRVALCLVAALLSHGLLDACTDGGPGIAFFAPFSNARYFFPWRPIAVSPIGVEGVLGERGLRIFLSEARWILLPAALLAGSAILWRSRARSAG